jgi:hypothetical protein
LGECGDWLKMARPPMAERERAQMQRDRREQGQENIRLRLPQLGVIQAFRPKARQMTVADMPCG